MRLIVIAFLVLILVSLGSALFHLLRHHGESTRTVKALTWRVLLSVTLFVILMTGYYFGLIKDRL
jgi:hypothetical protein